MVKVEIQMTGTLLKAERADTYDNPTAHWDVKVTDSYTGNFECAKWSDTEFAAVVEAMINKSGSHPLAEQLVAAWHPDVKPV